MKTGLEMYQKAVLVLHGLDKHLVRFEQTYADNTRISKHQLQIFDITKSSFNQTA